MGLIGPHPTALATPISVSMIGMKHRVDEAKDVSEVDITTAATRRKAAIEAARTLTMVPRQ